MVARELEVYKLSVQLVLDVYETTSTFPKSETFGLASQMRRCAVSIPCNLAEGGGRTSPNELQQFITIARGSCAELSTLVEISGKLGFITNPINLEGQIEIVGKMLTALAKSVRARSQGSVPPNNQ